MLEGLVWSELLSTAGLDALTKIQDSGVAIEDRTERRRYYAHVARRAAVRFALLHGKQPRDWNKPVVCNHCGPVWIEGDAAPGQPWDRVDQCPYCKIKAPLHGFARPRVQCAACKFLKASVDPITGRPSPWGFCEALSVSVGTARAIHCTDWRPKEG